jgi:hypothetical protein
LSHARELLAALTHANVGGFLSGPPGLDGEPALGLAGVHGAPRGRTWDAVASAKPRRSRSSELAGLEEDVVELTIVDGDRTLTLDGETTIRSLAALDALAEPYEDVVLHAEVVDGDLYAVDVFPL